MMIHHGCKKMLFFVSRVLPYKVGPLPVMNGVTFVTPINGLKWGKQKITLLIELFHLMYTETCFRTHFVIHHC